MSKSYRNGPIGALMDEYERAAFEFMRVIEPLSQGPYAEIRDAQTRDENCRSVQTIVSHVVNSGYGYANYIRTAFSLLSTPYTKRPLEQNEASPKMLEMLEYTSATLEGRWIMTDEEIQSVLIDTGWGVRCDIEQLLEHAIVHVLRHRRQIERFLDA